MDVKCIDKFGLGQVLMMDGYSLNDFERLKIDIRQQFREVAEILFNEVTASTPPSCIAIKLAQQYDSDMGGEHIAVFDSRSSTYDSLVFIIYEQEIRRLLDNYDVESSKLREIVFHEMTHAVDMKNLKQRNGIVSSLHKKSVSCYLNAFNDNDLYGQARALRFLISKLDSYRAEGVALLSESMASGSPIPLDKISRDIKVFKGAFWLLLETAKGFKPAQSISELTRFRIACIEHSIYEISPSLILHILRSKHAIDDRLWNRITGNENNLDKSEVVPILRVALGMGLSEALDSLMNIAEVDSYSITLDNLYKICCLLDYDLDDEKMACMDSILELGISENISAETFNHALRDIIGSRMTDDELMECYEKIRSNVKNDQESLLELVASLMDKMQQYARGTENGDVARWALTYFFDEEDLVNDEIPERGLLDDQIILERAVGLLN